MKIVPISPQAIAKNTEPEKVKPPEPEKVKLDKPVVTLKSSPSASKVGFDALDSQAKSMQMTGKLSQDGGASDAISKFMKDLESSTTPKKLEALLSNPLYSDALLGENRIIGLLGSLYGKTAQDGMLTNSIVGQLIRYINSDQDAFFIASVITAVTTQIKALDEANLKALSTSIAQLESPPANVLAAIATFTEAVAQLPTQPPTPAPLPLQPGKPTEVPTQKTENLRTALLQSAPLSFAKNAEEARENEVRTKGMKRLSTDFSATLRGSKELESAMLASVGTRPIIGPLDENTPVTLTPAIAIVTTPSATLPEGLLHYPGIRVVTSDVDHYIKSFIETFQQLFKQGFQTIYVILPDPDYWHACHYAKHAAYKMEEHIKVINAKTFGMGLRFIIENLAFILYQQHNSKNFEAVVKRAVSKVRYWVMPSMSTIQSHFWFTRLSRKFAKIGPKSHPLMAFHDPIHLVNAPAVLSQTTELFIAEVLKAIKESTHLPSQITLEYEGFFQEATLVKQAIQSAYPKIKFNVQSAPDTLCEEFGKHLGLCMLVR